MARIERIAKSYIFYLLEDFEVYIHLTCWKIDFLELSFHFFDLKSTLFKNFMVKGWSFHPPVFLLEERDTSLLLFVLPKFYGFLFKNGQGKLLWCRWKFSVGISCRSRLFFNCHDLANYKWIPSTTPWRRFVCLCIYFFSPGPYFSLIRIFKFSTFKVSILNYLYGRVAGDLHLNVSQYISVWITRHFLRMIAWGVPYCQQNLIVT